MCFNDEEKEVLKEIMFLTAKPILYICNVSEEQLQNLDDDEYTLKSEDTQSFTTTPDKVITPDINTYDGFKCINADTEYMLDEDSSKNTIKIY